MEIKIYSTQGCPYCKMAKSYFDEKGLAYENIDVGEDKEAARLMIEKSGEMGVPQIEINGKIIVGFQKDIIEKELNV